MYRNNYRGELFVDLLLILVISGIILTASILLFSFIFGDSRSWDEVFRNYTQLCNEADGHVYTSDREHGLSLCITDDGRIIEIYP